MQYPKEHLAFRVDVATEADMPKVAELRALSYGKHLPELGAKLVVPEASDFELGCQVFVAKSKLDDSVLGTIRAHTNAIRDLPLQASIALPERYNGTRMVEATRFCIKGKPGSSVVRAGLLKAMFEYCLKEGVDWLMAAGRHPIDRMYDGLLFEDIEEQNAFYPMAHASNIPHRVMCLPPSSGRDIWRRAEHPLYKFVCETNHPDIDISAALDLSSFWAIESSEVAPLVDRRQMHSLRAH